MPNSLPIKHLRIATRPSKLAMWQAQYVATQLQIHHPKLKVEIVKIHSEGDTNQHTPLQQLGGKIVFAKALQQALLQGEVDIAVHSIKDLAVIPPDGLQLACVLKRAPAHDVLISNQHTPLAQLADGARIGTSSPRRQCQLHAVNPHLISCDIRGNIETRLEKLRSGEYDAIILAYAGILRLGLEQNITEDLSIKEFIPAIGQGAIGIECRAVHKELVALLAPLEDPRSRYCISAEQAVNQVLGGGCHTPIAAHATFDPNGTQLELHAMVGSTQQPSLYAQAHCPASMEQAQLLGIRVAQELIDNGAKELLV